MQLVMAATRIGQPTEHGFHIHGTFQHGSARTRTISHSDNWRTSPRVLVSARPRSLILPTEYSLYVRCTYKVYNLSDPALLTLPRHDFDDVSAMSLITQKYIIIRVL